MSFPCRLVILLMLSFAGPLGADGALVVRHLSSHTTAIAGQSRVIVFRVDAAHPERVLPEFSLSNGEILEILKPPCLEAGESIGYLRVRGQRPGETTLAINGAKLKVNVVEADAGNEDQFRPEIVGPVSGAVVWGEVAIGVELRMREYRSLREVVIRHSDGTIIRPVDDTGRAHRPYRQLVFPLDLRKAPDGPLVLTPVAIDQGGREQSGPAVSLQVQRPSEGDVVSGEAEARYELERPQRFEDARRSIGRDKSASGGAFFLNSSNSPAFCFPLDVLSPGWYQVMLVTSGTRAQGALPTIGITVDDGDRSTTNGRVLHEKWHRAAFGVPFLLEPGEHVITPYFANDFYVSGRVDRNLFIDRIEVARVADGQSDSASSGSGGMMMMSMSSGAAFADGPCDDPFGLRAVPLRVAWNESLDGKALPGLVELEGRCWWSDVDRAPAPVVTLLVNGKPVLRQRSAAPRFWVDPSNYLPGANTFQLVAKSDSGATAKSCVQTMQWEVDGFDPSSRPPARMHHRYSIHEKNWSSNIRALLRNQHYPKERRAACFYASETVFLSLPEALSGSFHVYLELRGDQFKGPPQASVSLQASDETIEVGKADAPGGWQTVRAGSVDLEAGPKRIAVAFANDLYEEGVGDRNLWMQSLMLVQQPLSEDITAPSVKIHYPPDDHPAWMVDAVVASVSDDASLSSAELVIDGVRTGLTTNLNLEPGQVMLPLLLRTVEAGPHRVAVRVTDVTGNVALSEVRTIHVLEGAPEKPGRYARAVRLVNRLAFGPDQDELADILRMGESDWLRGHLERTLGDAGDRAAFSSYLPYFVDRNPYSVARRAVSHALMTPNPVRTRFGFWAQNHFSTWIRKTAGVRKWDEHVAFSRLGVARFADLLSLSAESPAMLTYLDQDTSFAGQLNENYARELMELHTLGVDGGYAQSDVTRLASLLTGCTVSFEGDGRGGGESAQDFTFRFDPRLSDGAAIRVMGMTFAQADPSERYDRVRLALELLIAHPSTARFVSRSLVEHYVRAPAPDVLVDVLAEVFVESYGDMRAVMCAMIEHPRFWSDPQPERVASAFDFAVRLCRTTKHWHPWRVGDFLQSSGQGLFDRSTPDGYPEEDAENTASNSLIQRWRLAREMRWQLTNLVPGTWRSSPNGPVDEWRQRVIDLIAVRLTGRVLGSASNKAAMELFASANGNTYEQVLMIAPFIAQLPELQMR